MKPAIVQSREIVALLGAGSVTKDALSESLAFALTIVAADGGAKFALDLGHVPDAVIGDFDSLPEALRRAIPRERLHKVSEQDSTDFEKAISRIQAKLILAVGFTGRRLDHELAVYNALVRHRECPVVVIGAEDLCFHVNVEITLKLALGTRVSLFPLAEVVCRSNGLRWPTDHLTFQPWGRVGTSNEAASPVVTLSPQGPGMLAILPRATLPDVIAALTGS